MDLNHHFAVSHQQRLLTAAERHRARRQPRRRARATARRDAPGVAVNPQASPCPTC